MTREERERLAATAAAIEAWLADDDDSPVADDVEVRRRAALQLMVAMEEAYDGLMPFVGLIEDMVAAATKTAMAEDVAASRVVVQAAHQELSQALMAIRRQPADPIGADEPLKVLASYARLAAIAGTPPLER